MLAEEPPLPREDGAQQQVRRFYLVRPVVSCQRFAWAWKKRRGTKWRVKWRRGVDYTVFEHSSPFRFRRTTSLQEATRDVFFTVAFLGRLSLRLGHNLGHDS